jgi:hypothetical protein
VLESPYSDATCAWFEATRSSRSDTFPADDGPLPTRRRRLLVGGPGNATDRSRSGQAGGRQARPPTLPFRLVTACCHASTSQRTDDAPTAGYGSVPSTGRSKRRLHYPARARPRGTLTFRFVFSPTAARLQGDSASSRDGSARFRLIEANRSGDPTRLDSSRGGTDTRKIVR